MKRFYLFFFVIFVQFVHADEAALSLQTVAESIRESDVNNIVITSIEQEGQGLVIYGEAKSNNDISGYMRFLDEKYGFPSLESIKREQNNSVFVLKIKKIR